MPITYLELEFQLQIFKEVGMRYSCRVIKSLYVMILCNTRFKIAKL